MTMPGRNALDVELSVPSDLTSQDSAAARALDRAASEELGLPSIVLMENAARGLALRIRSVFGPEARALVLAGKGNNGGDGLALTRWMHPRARALLLAEPDPQQSPDAALQLQILQNAGIEVEIAPPLQRLHELARGADLIVDALLGTGLASAPRGLVAEWIEWIGAQPLPVFAVDLPSGLSSDTGEAMAPCVRAQETVSFARPKKGLLLRDGPEHAGRVQIVSLGLPESWVEARDR